MASGSKHNRAGISLHRHFTLGPPKTAHMISYLIRRVLQMIPTLLGVILLVFFLFKYFGGDPSELLAGMSATPQQIASIRGSSGWIAR